MICLQYKQLLVQHIHARSRRLHREGPPPATLSQKIVNEVRQQKVRGRDLSTCIKGFNTLILILKALVMLVVGASPRGWLRQHSRPKPNSQFDDQPGLSQPVAAAQSRRYLNLIVACSSSPPCTPFCAPLLPHHTGLDAMQTSMQRPHAISLWLCSLVLTALCIATSAAPLAFKPSEINRTCR